MKKIKLSNYKKNYQKGFTLIEILVASSILVILAFGFLGLQYIIGQNQVSVWRNYLSMEGANTALSTLSRELRNARQSDTGGYLLESANDNEIIFYSDIDYDQAIERVHYTLSSNQLSKGVIEPIGQPAVYSPESEKVKIVTDIVRNVSESLFNYYNSDWPADTVNNPLDITSRISEAAYIKITLRTNPNANDSDNDYYLESNVRLRMIF